MLKKKEELNFPAAKLFSFVHISHVHTTLVIEHLYILVSEGMLSLLNLSNQLLSDTEKIIT